MPPALPGDSAPKFDRIRDGRIGWRRVVALRDAAAQAAAVIARTMGYRVESPPLPDEAEHSDTLAAVPEFSGPVGPATGAGAVPSQLERAKKFLIEHLKASLRTSRATAAIASWANLAKIADRIAGITP